MPSVWVLMMCCYPPMPPPCKRMKGFSILSLALSQKDMMPTLILGYLARDGILCFVGCVEPLSKAPNIGPMIFRRRMVAGSLIGGIAETQEMLDFCGEHNIVSDIELINMQDINQAYERTIKGDVKYRFVIDINSLKS